MNPILYFINCRLKSRKLYHAISILVVTVSVAVLVIALALSNGFEKTLLDKLIVAAPHVTVSGDYKLVVSDQKEQVKNELELAQVQALAINPDNNFVHGILLRGTTLEKLPELLKKKEFLIQGALPVKDQAIVGSKLAEKLELSVGDTIEVLTGPAISTDFIVSGIFKVGLYDFDANVVIAPFEDIVLLKPEQGEGVAADVVTFKAYWLNQPMQAVDFAENIKSFNSNILVTNWQEDNKALISAIAIEKKVIFIVLLLLVIASSVAIANSQFVQILSQREHIAFLSAIGFNSKQILYTYLFEGIFIGLIGSLSGMIIALLVTFYLSEFPLALPVDVYQVEVIPVILRPRDMFLTMLSAVIIFCISSFVPAYYASRLDPVQILRRI